MHKGKGIGGEGRERRRGVLGGEDAEGACAVEKFQEGRAPVGSAVERRASWRRRARSPWRRASSGMGDGRGQEGSEP